MAALFGVTRDRISQKPVDTRLEIEPIAPSTCAPLDAYRVHIGPNEERRVFQSVLSLHDYQCAHSTMRFFAEVLGEAEALLELPCKHIVVALVGVHYSLWWADFWLTNASSRAEPRAVNVDMYVYDETKESNPDTGFVGDRCTAYGFRTTAEEARRFGDSLMGELIAAWHLRRESGLSVPEDELWPGYFADDPKWSTRFRDV
jgi:hypothetical protein